jgi:isopentenyl diphosphate isomerase/L-lactate dehydrogenase-like FMN-dependent dehydrogenase
MPYVNLDELEPLARELLPPPIFDFIAGGAEDEVTLRRNREAFEAIEFRPRVLVDVTNIDTRTTVLGEDLALPVMLAPVALHQLSNGDGELATARAAADAGTVMILSTMSSATMEDVAAASAGPKWYQLYCYSDRGVTERLVRRAESAGYRALVLTVDVPRLGRRERDFRHPPASFPPNVFPRNFIGEVDVSAVAEHDQGTSLSAMVAALLDASLTWDVIAWLRSITSLPVLVKGVLCGEDAALAVEHGCAGIVVSNHGGRQLDGVPASIDALPEVVEAVAGRATVLMDGGVRRGTDVLKALALGADAVLIGRPYIWGLAVDGQAGVAGVLEMLRAELSLGMSLAGVTNVSQIRRELVRVRNTYA